MFEIILTRSKKGLFKKLALAIGALVALGAWLGWLTLTDAQRVDISPVKFVYGFNTGDSVPDNVTLPSTGDGVLQVTHNNLATDTAGAVVKYDYTSSTTCDQTTITTNSTTLDYTSGYTVNLPLDGDEICFEIAWGTGVDAKAVYAITYTPNNFYTNIIKQDGNRLTAKSKSGFSDYRILTTLQTTAAASCGPTGFTDTVLYKNIQYNYTIPAVDYVTTKNNQWYCMRAYKSQRYVYFAYQIDTVGPTLTFKNFNDYTNTPATERQITATAAETIKSNTWQYVLPTTTDLTGCDKSRFVNNNNYRLSNVRLGQSFKATEANNGQWTCFRAADLNGNYSYVAEKIAGVDLTGPSFSVAQTYDTASSVKKVTITFDNTADLADLSTNTSSVFYRYKVYSGSTTCSKTTIASNALLGATGFSPSLTLNNTNSHGQTICFWVKDSLDNVNGAQVSLDLRAPTISRAPTYNLAKTRAYLNGQKTESTDKAYYKITSTNPDCTSLTLVVATTDPVGPIVNGNFLCVAIQDQFGNRSSTKEYGPISVNATIPDVVVTQNTAQQISATQRGALSGIVWRVRRNTTSLNNCRSRAASLYNGAESYTASTLLDLRQSNDHGKVYCFIAKYGNNYGAEGLVVDLQGPALSLSQSYVSATDTWNLIAKTNDTDYNNTTWNYKALVGNDQCQAGLTNMVNSTETSRQLTLTLTNSDNGKVYCVSLADKLNNVAWAKMTVSTSRPIISLSQSNHLLNVSSNSTTDKLAYYITSSVLDDSLNCGGVSPSYTRLSTSGQVTLSTSHGGKYVCVRATNTQNASSYKSLLLTTIDRQAPRVNAIQTANQTVKATDNDPANNYWQWRILSSGEVCSATILTTPKTSYNEGSALDVSNKNGKTFCFWSTDAAGNTGWDKVTVNLGRLVITTSQTNQKTIKATSNRLAGLWHYKALAGNEYCNTTILTGANGYFRDTEISVQTHGQTYCFWANDGAKVYFAKITVDLQGPTIRPTYNYNKTSLTVSTTSSKDTVAYFKSEKQPDCSATTTSVYLALPNKRLSLQTGDNTKWFCLRALDSFGNDSYLATQIKLNDQTAPKITVKQEGVVLTATDNDRNPTNMGWRVLGLNQSCQDTTGQAYIEGQILNLSSAEHGQTYCFWSIDQSNNVGYSVLTIDLIAPTLQVDQNNATVVASTNDPSAAITYARSSSQPVCQSVTTYRTGSRVTGLRQTDEGQWLCFKVADKSQNQTFVAHQITDVNPQIPTVYIGNSTSAGSHYLRATDNQTTTNSWSWRILDSNQVCSSTILPDTTVYSEGSWLPANQDGRTYCFWSQNPVTGLVGFNSQKVSITSPSVWAQQTNQGVLATSTQSNLSWSWRILSANQVCNATILPGAVTYTAGQLLPAVGYQGQTYCFWANDINGNVGYDSVTVTLSQPSITITTNRAGNLITALSSGQVSHFVSVSPPLCRPGTNSSFTLGSVVIVAPNQTSQYICFKSVAQDGGQSYRLHTIGRIDQTAPVVSVFQSGQTIYAQDNEQQPTIWSYRALSAGQVCSPSILSGAKSYVESQALWLSGSDQTYCFWSIDATGNVGYNQLTVDLTPPRLWVSQTNSAVVVLTDSLNDTVLWTTFNGQNCQQQTGLVPFEGLTLTVADNGRWLCFKAIDRFGNESHQAYQVRLVSQTTPTVQVSQSGQTIRATDNLTAATDWQYRALAASEVCSGAILSGAQAYSEGTKLDLTNSPDGQLYCFWSQTQAGQVGYGFVQADLAGPQVSANQNDRSQVSASSSQTASNWRYKVLGQSETCSQNVLAGAIAYRAGQKITASQPAGTIYCFWAQDSYGNVGFDSVRLVKSQEPVVKTDHPTNQVRATSPDTTLGNWQYVKLDDGQKCGPQTNFAQASDYNLGQALEVDEQDHGKVYCFRALSPAGTYSYASQTATYTQPPVVVTPDGSGTKIDDGLIEPDPAPPEEEDDFDWLPVIYIAAGVLVLVLALWSMFTKKD